jgi:hypothetical protein
VGHCLPVVASERPSLIAVHSEDAG